MASPLTSRSLEPREHWAAGEWLSDFASDALPPTPALTFGQRRVLQGCLELFADQGFAGSSIRDIAAASGLQPASLYNHFPSKDAMLSALMMLGHEHHLDEVLAAVLAAPPEPRAQLQALIHAHVRVHCEYPRLGLIVSREDRFLSDSVRPQVALIRARSRKITADIIERGREQGVFTPVSSQVTILALASMGVDSARWFPYQNEIGVDELARDYALLAMRMLGAPTED